MIFKNSAIVVIFYTAWIDGIFGTSYSKVYVNSGSNGPYQYTGYGAPAVAYSAPIAQLTAAPVGSVVPYPQAASFVSPCVSPCAPQQPIAQIANPGLVAYTAPRTVVVAKDVPTNYEYSYVVYDDGTGDQKAARELSDGGVVRGQYSFLQPDGYVREVQYTADDVTGFNAVVNYLPAGDQKTVEVKDAKPCPDVKPEALKQAEDSKGDQSTLAEKPSETESKPASEEPAKEASESSSSESSEKSAESAPEAPKSEAPAPESPVAEAPETSVPEIPPAKAPTSEEEASAEKPAKEGEAKSEESKEVQPSGEAVSAEVTEDKTPAVENAIVESVEAPQPAPAVISYTLPPGFVSYEQLLNCIQKMQNSDLRVNSPLTYILLPSNAKPC